MAHSFGPGTVTFDAGAFSCEVTGGSIGHTYDEVERKATLCDTTKPAPTKVRGNDTLSLSLVNDLTADGLYKYLQDNDLATVPVAFTPNTALGASWTGDVILTLPDSIGASEWGSDIESELTLTCPGTFTFTAGA